MTTLAPKLPWQHAFAGGFNRLGGQALPTDADAIDYLNRVKAADGAAVEVGVAQAIDAFVKGCKADNAGYSGDPTRTNWDAIQACCIMAGARTISGALVPLKTPYGSELWDGTATPTILNSDGSAATWTASTQTMAITSPTATSTSYPRFLFPIAGMSTTKQHVLAGRFSGAISQVTNVRLGGIINGSYNSSTGEFYAKAYPSTSNIEFDLNGTQTGSLTIESLSIREDSFTPTAQGGWTASDYSRGGTTPGLKGNGSTLYLDSNRADSADGQNDHHIMVYSTQGDANNAKYAIGVSNGTSPSSYTLLGRDYWSRSTSQAGVVATIDTGTYALSRSSGSSFDWMRGSVLQTPADKASTSSTSGNSHFVFAYNSGSGAGSPTSARLSFYSLGSALDLAALDARTSHLMNSIRFTLLTGLNPAGYDPATLAYLLAAYTAGGSLA